MKVISPNSKSCYALTQSAEWLFDAQNLHWPCPLWPVWPTSLAPRVSLLLFWALWLCVILDTRVFCTFWGTRAVWEAHWNKISRLQGCIGWQQTINWATVVHLCDFLLLVGDFNNFCSSSVWWVGSTGKGAEGDMKVMCIGWKKS